ncbi:hypothetical protein [uncultured Ilyobacter sp.]|uniref:hypothetical protein n=1 Tax=uncultured Ilyobacter sp. TaxID=544433 RepID=UPI0029F4D108|nr:hypothetical protein [uncultured Ilyobacter sp.]
MKKWLLILTAILALSSVAYADSNDKNYEERGYYNGHMMGPGYGRRMMGPGYGGYMMGPGYGQGMMGPGYGGYMMGPGYHRGTYEDDIYMPQRRLTPEEEKAYMKIREENLKIYSQYGRSIGRKQLEIETELLNDSPDWKKIQKLNDEIAALESKLKTELMKKNYGGGNLK